MRTNEAGVAALDIRAMSVHDESGEWPVTCVYVAGRPTLPLRSDYEEARVLAKSLVSRLESIDECTLNARLEDLLAHVDVLAACLARGRSEKD